VAPRSPLVPLALACHAVLALTVVVLVFRGASSPLAGTILGGLAAAPLLATLRGLAVASRVRAWVAVLLVVYVGAMSVETVATSGAATLASFALLTAVLELGMLLAIIRRSQSRPRAASE
jgi:hypothetical protein